MVENAKTGRSGGTEESHRTGESWYRGEWLLLSSPKPAGKNPTVVSRHIYADLGYEEEDIADSSSFWLDHIHPEDTPRVLAALSRESIGEVKILEYRFRHKDGTYRWMHDVLQLALDPHSRGVEVVGCWIDLTAHKQAAAEAGAQVLKQVPERTDDTSTIAEVLEQRINELKQTEVALKASEARYEDHYHNAPDMFASTDPSTTTIVQANRTLAEATGYTKDEIIGRSVFDLHHPDCRSEVESAVRLIGEAGEVRNADLQLKRKDGNKIDVSARVAALRDETGTLYNRWIWRDTADRKRMEEALRKAHEGLEQDVQKRTAELTAANEALRAEVIERQRAEAALFEEKERAEITLQSIGDAVITTDAKGIVTYLNPVSEALTGVMVDEARGRQLDSVLHIVQEHSGERVRSPVAECLELGQATQLAQDTILIHRSGQEYAIQDSAAPIRNRVGEVVGVVLVFSDVTETKRAAQLMSYQARHDALTGLVNRREFEQRLGQAVAGARDHGASHALCYLDLDQFKIVNDTAGHACGDALLKQLALLLQRKIRARDSLGRIGGDEFSLLLEHCSPKKAVEIADALVAAVRDFRFVWEDLPFEISVSIGLVPITGAAESAAQLLTRADRACYEAKELGRDRVQVYQVENEKPLQGEMEVHRDARLSEALAQNRFRLYAQPIRSLTPGADEPVYYELLLRLLDTTDQLLLPRAFIPAAERSGLITAIDRWVIRTAFCSYRELLNASARGVGISINLSGKSLSDPSLLAFVCQQLADYPVPPEQVCFEITESSVIRNLIQATQFMTDMKKYNCRFALDDFGRGFSSFTYLKQLPVDYLKIDGSFVQNMVSDGVNCAMVAAINQVAHIMGIQTIAESAESEETVHQLKELGVDYVQGNVAGSPRPLAEISSSDTTP